MIKSYLYENLKKIIFSNLEEEKLGHKVLQHQVQNAKEIWNNSGAEKSNAIGVERILKMFLVLIQFVFPGIYVRAIFGGFGKLHKHIGIEIYVIFKLLMAFIILYYEFYRGIIGVIWIGWSVLETIFYLSNLIINDDVFAKPYSHKRNIILVLIDYVAINIDFASIYLYTNSIGVRGDNIIDVVTNKVDAIYFSFVTSLTIGYGDIAPINHLGQKLVVSQAIIFLLFGVLFLNIYTSRIRTDK